MVRIVRPLFSASNVEAAQGVNTVLANGANGATTVNSVGGVIKDPYTKGAWIDLTLANLNGGLGVVQTADVVTQAPGLNSPNPNKGIIAANPSLAKGLGVAGFLVGTAGTIKDGADIYGSMHEDGKWHGDWSKIPASEVFSILGNGLNTVSAGAATAAAAGVAASATGVAAPVGAPVATGAATTALITGVLGTVLSTLSNIVGEKTIGEVLAPASEFFDDVVSGDLITRAIEGLGEHIKDGLIDLNEIMDDISKNLSDFIKDIINGAKDAWDKFTESLPDFTDPATWTNWLPDIFNPWKDANREGKHYFYDPLVLDLDGDGIETVKLDTSKASANAYFDFDGDGLAHATGWVKKDDGILVQDINGDGIINNGTEVFGDSTIKKDGTTAKHGFDTLADLDDNGDGLIDSNDIAFNLLKIWKDNNGDGISQADELISLETLGITSLNVAYNDTNRTVAGGKLSQLGSYNKGDKSYSMGDVDFNFSSTYSRYQDRIGVNNTIAALPILAGVGRLRDLHEAAMGSDKLTEVLGRYQAATDKSTQLAIMDELLLAWAQTDPNYKAYEHQMSLSVRIQNEGVGIAGNGGTTIPTAEGMEKINNMFAAARSKIGVLDSFLGTTTDNLYFVNPSDAERITNTIHSSYANIVAYAYAGLYGQTASYQALLSYVDVVFDVQGDAAMQVSLDMSRLADYLDESLGAQDGFVAAMEFLSHFGAMRNPNIAITGLDKLADVIGSTLQDIPKQTLDVWITHINSHLWNKGGIYLGSDARDTAKAAFIAIGLDGNDRLSGSYASDALMGGTGNDTLSAYAGDDVLHGDVGDDTLNGGDGDDILNGGTGNDRLYGEKGSDTYVFSKGHGQDVICDYEYIAKNQDNPQDKVVFNDIVSSEVQVAIVGYDLVLSGYHDTDQVTIQYFQHGDNYWIEQFEFSDGTFTIDDLMNKTAYYEGTDANNNQNITQWLGAINANLGAGHDYLDAGRLGQGVIADGGEGNDIIYARNANDILHGGTGNDTLNAYAGDDVLNGDAGDDTLNGGDGDDTLNGGTGNDRLNGEKGSDTYVFSKGHGQDIIYDYEYIAKNQDNPQDKIVLSDVRFDEVQINVFGNDLILSGYHKNDSITIKNHRYGTNYQIEQFEFSDKTLDLAALIQQANTAAIL